MRKSKDETINLLSKKLKITERELEREKKNSTECRELLRMAIDTIGDLIT
jgi:hypothetical protein